MTKHNITKGTKITPQFRVRLEAALRGRTHTDLMALVDRKPQSQYVGRALQGYPLTRSSHEILEDAVAAAERLKGGGNVGTPSVVADAAPAPTRTSRAVVEAALDELGEAQVLLLIAKRLARTA